VYDESWATRRVVGGEECQRARVYGARCREGSLVVVGGCLGQEGSGDGQRHVRFSCMSVTTDS